ncbi:MAG TPA: SAM-dependent methyltransferase [Pirellulales bacterium]|nr:SAM-dependent methyltransferase [Pirellulales bacterium]
MGAIESADIDRPRFLFATCQVGAEGALKQEVARLWPSFRFAYSRPGFLTFRLPAEETFAPDFHPQLVFARAAGFSLGKISAPTLKVRADELCRAIAAHKFDALHVWQRDTQPASARTFDPRPTPSASEAEAEILKRWCEHFGSQPARVAEPNGRVLDCTLVEGDTWWIGEHRARSDESRFPGGVRDLRLPDSMVSRAYLKMEEALAWSELPIQAGQRAVELGCAPGGASQSLLSHGLIVLGVDPAEVDPRVLGNPNFVHLRMRGSEVRRRRLRGVRWLTADMNVAPQTTLDTVEALVTHPTVNVQGLLVTLKLLEWEMAAHLDEYLSRIRGWGYAHVRAKQLAFNRQEICVAALRRKRERSPGKSATSAERPSSKH